MNDDYDEAVDVAEAMIKYGGSFVSSLGKALRQADHININKIKSAFPEYWKQYSDMAQKRME